jgi:hypothetical protein
LTVLIANLGRLDNLLPALSLSSKTSAMNFR